MAALLEFTARVLNFLIRRIEFLYSKTIFFCIRSRVRIGTTRSVTVVVTVVRYRRRYRRPPVGMIASNNAAKPSFSVVY